MNKKIKIGLYVLLVTVAVLFGLVVVFGRKFLVRNEPVKSVNISYDVLKKQDEKGQILKGQVVKYDTTSLTVAIEGEGGEKNFSNLAEVSVWTVGDGKGEAPKKTDWSKIAAGQKISLSMDKPGQKLISVIIYE